MKLSTFIVRVVTAAVVISGLASCYTEEKVLAWTAIHVSGDNRSGESHLIKTPAGRFILIDTGFDRFASTDLIPTMREAGVNQLEKILITHGHRNHYGALKSVLKEFDVKQVVFNPPREAACLREAWAMGCNMAHINETLDFVSTNSVLINAFDGDTVYQEDDVTIEMISAKSQSPELSVNEASDMFLLNHKGIKILFTGDIAQNAEQLLLDRGSDLKAHAMTAPHHGLTATVSDALYETVKPDFVTVGVSLKLWHSNRATQTRQYLHNNGISTYVSGHHGTARFISNGKAIYEQ